MLPGVALTPTDRCCRRARGCQGAAWKHRDCLTGGVPADLDSPCARRPAKSTVGAEESLRRGRTKETTEEARYPSVRAVGAQNRAPLRSPGLGSKIDEATTARWGTLLHAAIRPSILIAARQPTSRAWMSLGLGLKNQATERGSGARSGTRHA